MSIPREPRVVVTGGAGGLGRAFCLALAARGARLVIGDRDLAGAQETATLVQGRGGSAFAMTCDVSDLKQIEALAAAADERLGGVDLLINNAGVAVGGAVGTIPLADWEWIVGINMWGVIYGCHVFVPRMKAQGSGHVLNVASAAGLLSAPEMGPYNVTKAAVVALSETLSGELRPLGLGVTVLCPTFFQTNIKNNARMVGIEKGLDALVDQRMQQSKLQADDVARIALDACDKDQLFVVPMADGKWLWRLKRLAPERYFAMAPSVIKRLQKSAERN